MKKREETKIKEEKDRLVKVYKVQEFDFINDNRTTEREKEE